MRSHTIGFLASALLAIGFVGSSHAQNALPINAAASVNGFIISNDLVEQGIQVPMLRMRYQSMLLLLLMVSSFRMIWLSKVFRLHCLKVKRIRRNFVKQFWGR